MGTYRPALDGLRALAIFLVVARHDSALSGGFFGVDLFFVLSGYLITEVLLSDWTGFGQIRIGRFYLNRALRLYPALLLMLGLFVAIDPALLSDAAITSAYLSDYFMAFAGIPERFPHTWSLAVEEHFYLLWPPILALMLRRWTPLTCGKIMLVTYIAATLWRFEWWNSGQTWDCVYFRFDTRMTGLILGCALRLMPIRAPWLASVAALGIIAYFVASTEAKSDAALLYAMTSVEIASAVLIAGVDGGFFRAVLSFPALTYVGKLSYGIYLWHYPIMRGEFPGLVGIALSVIAAAISYHTIEAAARYWRRSLTLNRRGEVAKMRHDSVPIRGG